MFNIGIVGVGAIAQSHKEALEKNQAFNITAICDLNIEKANELAIGTSANTYTDYKIMQTCEKLDAVILNLPHYLHKEVSIYFLEKHITVLVEKPMATSVDECIAMIETSRKNDTPIVVGHVQKYYGCYKKLHDIIETGSLGKLCSMTETRNVDYFTNRPSWFLKKKFSGGGIVMNYCAHTLDKILYLTEAEIEDVFASGNNFITNDDVEASAQVLLRLSNGASAALTYCGTKVPGQYDTFFYFTKGMVNIQNGGSRLVVVKSDGSTEQFDFDNQDIYIKQIGEFEKLLKGQENELVTAYRGQEIIDVLEKIIKQIVI